MWDRKTMKLWPRAIKNRSRSFNIYQVKFQTKKKRESEKEIIFKKIIPENFLDIKQNINESSDFRSMHTSQQYNF